MKYTDMLFAIMAGGKGTRIGNIAKDIPKPMVDICGKPLLERQIDMLAKQGITEVFLVVGHLGHVIKDYFQEDKKPFGIRIKYIEEMEPLGTAGALYFFKQEQKTICLMNGDLLFDINFETMFQYHVEKTADITLFTHPNGHPYDSALIETDQAGRVCKWINKEDERHLHKNRVNAGIHIMEPQVLDFMSQPVKLDLDRDILKSAINQYNVFAYDSPEYVHDVGTPDRYQKACSDYKIGLPDKKNLKQIQKAIFLDRDGTINEHVGFITNPEQLKLLEGVADAIRKINTSEYLAIVVTNQPVIARGDCSIDELECIHNKLEMLLGEEGAYIDDLFYCPHHPDRGYAGEIKEYKKKCACRKPESGMLLMAAEKFHIDLSNSYMIGDCDSDMEAGVKAGCHTIFMSQDTELQAKIKYGRVAHNLLEAVRTILDDYNEDTI